MASNKELKIHEFLPTDVPISKVVVYRNRAEITRVLQFKAEAGEHEVILAEIPSNIEEGSLRVEGRGLAAVITDVNLSTSFVSKSRTPDYDQKEKELRDIVEKLEQNKVIEQQENERLKQKKKFWDKCLESLSKDVFAVKNGQSYPVTPEIIGSLASFLENHEVQTKKVEEKILEHDRLMVKLDQDWQAANQNLAKHTGELHGPSHRVAVLLQVTSDDMLELTIRYVVGNAYWNPKYDVRITDDQKKLTISYYAVISQRTGEEWNEVLLSLSTALPSLGGSIPSLGTKQVSFRSSPSFQPEALLYDGHTEASKKRRTMRSSVVQCASPMAVQVTTVQDQGINTTFDITKPTTIPTDGSEHKVTVGIIELEPKLQYKSIPKKAAQAFLEARAVNTSQYLILAGPGSIFFGSNFVATANLKTVSPQEEFSCSLGADPAVKVTYKPVRRFNEQSGMISKSHVVTYGQEIEIHNTRSQPISIVVVDQVPLSTEEKLKVVLLDPVLTREKPDGKGYLLNADNNLEHRIDIKQRDKYNFIIKYRLEYPSDKEIEETDLPATH